LTAQMHAKGFKYNPEDEKLNKKPVKNHLQQIP